MLRSDSPVLDSWQPGSVHTALYMFRRWYRQWFLDYWEHLWESNDRHVHFPMWNLGQDRRLPRVPTLQIWDMFETDSLDLPRAYMDELGNNSYHPKSREFVRRATLWVQMQLRSLRRLQTHLF